MALFSTKTKDTQIQHLEEEIEKLKRSAYTEKEPEKHERKQILFEWTAPVRFFVPREREWFINVALWVLLLIVIMLFVQQYLLILATIAVTFTSFVIAKIPPSTTTHRISTKGIVTFDKMYYWGELGEYWINEKQDQYIMTIVTKLRFPTALLFIVSEDDIASIVDILDNYLVYRETRKEQGWLNKMIDGMYLTYDDIKALTSGHQYNSYPTSESS